MARLGTIPAGAITGLITAVITAGILALAWQSPAPVDALRDRVFDSYTRVMPRPDAAAPLVAVVDIDAQAMARFGPWPWPRSYLAELTDRVFDQGAVAIGFDLTFPYPDPTSPDRILDSWMRFATDVPPSLPDLGLRPHDTLFAEALRDRPVVMRLAPGDAAAPPGRSPITALGDVPADMHRLPGVTPPLDILARAPDGLGADGLIAEDDGVVRRAAMMVRVGDDLRPGFAADLVRAAQGADAYEWRIGGGADDAIGLPGPQAPGAVWIGARPVPVDATGALRMRPGPRRGDATGATVSAARILAPQARDDALLALSGRIVLIGSTAPELARPVRTAWAPARPAVLVQADLVDQIVAGRFLTRPVRVAQAELAAILMLGLTLSVLLWRRRAAGAVAVAVVGTGAAILAGVVGYGRLNVLVDPSLPILTILTVLGAGLSLDAGLRSRARRRVRAHFAFPPPAPVVAAATAAPGVLSPGGDARAVTVVAIGIEGPGGPDDARLTPEIFGHIADIHATLADRVAAAGGIYDRMTDTGGVAVWNAPLAREDHAAAALTAVAALEPVAGALAAGVGGRVAIGAASGPAIVGSAGARGQRRYAVVGAVKDVAAALRMRAPRYGVVNCVAQATALAAPPDLLAVELDRVGLHRNGEAEPVFTLLDRAHPGADRFATLLGQARAAYLDRDWPAAEAGFTSLAALDVELCDTARLSQVYLDRIEGFHRIPPPIEWDGAALL